ncbi:MAG: anti-sigma factor antagonist, partial [Alphaproteobacteria bacterium]
PLSDDESLSGHVHAAVFPYRPLRKGRLALDAAIAAVFEDQSVRGLLHLLVDAREGVGAGQSAFTRGIFWAAPLEAA